MFNAIIDCKSDKFVYVIVCTKKLPSMLKFFSSMSQYSVDLVSDISDARWYDDKVDAIHALWCARVYYGDFACIAKYYYNKKVLCLQ